MGKVHHNARSGTSVARLDGKIVFTFDEQEESLGYHCVEEAFIEGHTRTRVLGGREWQHLHDVSSDWTAQEYISDSIWYRVEPMVPGVAKLQSRWPERLGRNHSATALPTIGGIVYIGGEPQGDPYARVPLMVLLSCPREENMLHDRALFSREFVWARTSITLDKGVTLTRVFHTVCSWNKFLIIFGGESPVDGSVFADCVALAFKNEGGKHHDVQVKAKVISCRGSLPCARSQHSAVVVKNTMFVFGGICAGQALSDLYMLELESGGKKGWTWTRVRIPSAGLTTPRFGASLALLDGCILFVGGHVKKGGLQDAVDKKEHLFLEGISGDPEPVLCSPFCLESEAFSDLLLVLSENHCLATHRILACRKLGAPFERSLVSKDNKLFVFDGSARLSLLAGQLLLEWICMEKITAPTEWNATTALRELLSFCLDFSVHWDLLVRVHALLNGGRVVGGLTAAQVAENHWPLGLRYSQTLPFADITLRVRNTFLEGDNDSSNSSISGPLFPCHRVILCQESRFFRSMLRSSFSESRAPIIDVDCLDADADSFEILLRYVYSGGEDFAVDDPNVALSLFPTAHMFELDLLCAWLERYIVRFLDTASASFVWKFARLYAIPGLRLAAASFVYANWEECSQTPHWNSLSDEEKRLLSPQ